MSINRYSLAGESVPNNASGRWVLYCDYTAEIRALTQENADLREENARLSAPVNDAEWAVSHWVKAGGSMRGFVDAFITARKGSRRGQYETTQYPSCDAAGKERK